MSMRPRISRQRGNMANLDASYTVSFAKPGTRTRTVHTYAVPVSSGGAWLSCSQSRYLLTTSELHLCCTTESFFRSSNKQALLAKWPRARPFSCCLLCLCLPYHRHTLPFMKNSMHWFAKILYRKSKDDKGARALSLRGLSLNRSLLACSHDHVLFPSIGVL